MARRMVIQPAERVGRCLGNDEFKFEHVELELLIEHAIIMSNK